MTHQLHQDDLFEGGPCHCATCCRLDQEEGLRAHDPRRRSQLRLPLNPMPHCAGEPSGLNAPEVHPMLSFGVTVPDDPAAAPPADALAEA